MGWTYTSAFPLCCIGTSWGDLYLYIIKSVAEKTSIVKTGFLWNRCIGSHVATRLVISAPHEVVILWDRAGAQGALDIKTF
jgi:hypothetical protein